MKILQTAADMARGAALHARFPAELLVVKGQRAAGPKFL